MNIRRRAPILLLLAVSCERSEPKEPAREKGDPVAALLEVLDRHPFVAPATSFGAAPAADGLARIRIDRSGAVQIEKGGEKQASLESPWSDWLARHRTRSSKHWIVGTDRATGLPVHWSAVEEMIQIREEYTGRVFPVRAGGSTLTALPTDPGIDMTLYSKVPSGAFALAPVRFSTFRTPQLPLSKIHRVRIATTEDPLDILFLSSRFGSDQLDDYRKAVEAVTTGVLGEHPFAALAARFNVWRIDIASVNDVSATPVHPENVLPAAPGPSWGASGLPDVLDRDLRIDLIEGREYAVWFTDQANDYDPIVEGAVTLIGRPVLVLVLLNTGEQLGGGRLGGHVAISTLRFLESVHGTGWQLASHELGHALGLYDEAANCDHRLDYTAGGPNIAASGETPAWSSQCPNGTCATLRKNICPGDSPMDEPPDRVGLWLGGNCDCATTPPGEDCVCATMTPTRQCRMFGWAAQTGFCSVCAGHVNQVLQQMGAVVVGPPPFEARTDTSRDSIFEDPGLAGPDPRLYLLYEKGILNPPLILSGPKPRPLEDLSRVQLDGGGEWLAQVEVGGTVGEVAIGSFDCTAKLPGSDKMMRISARASAGGKVVPIEVESAPAGEDQGCLVEDAVVHQKWKARGLSLPIGVRGPAAR